MANVLGCPECGCTELSTIEHLRGDARVRIERDEHAEIRHVFSGRTEIDWDSAETVGIRCSVCEWEFLGTYYAGALVDPSDEDRA